jgi:hypothetical protein
VAWPRAVFYRPSKRTPPSWPRVNPRCRPSSHLKVEVLHRCHHGGVAGLLDGVICIVSMVCAALSNLPVCVDEGTQCGAARPEATSMPRLQR